MNRKKNFLITFLISIFLLVSLFLIFNKKFYSKNFSKIYLEKINSYYFNCLQIFKKNFYLLKKKNSKDLKLEENNMENNRKIELYLVPLKSSYITFKTYGNMTSLCEMPLQFDNGGKISFVNSSRFLKKGDLILKINSSIEEKKCEKFKQILLIKKEKLTRLELLNTEELISLNEIEQIKVEILDIETRILECEQQIIRNCIYAPEEGFFWLENNILPETSVNHRQNLGYFFSKKKIIKFQIPYEYLNLINANTKIKLLFQPSNNSGNTYEASGSISLKSFKPLLPINENEHQSQFCEVNFPFEETNTSTYEVNQSGEVTVEMDKIEEYFEVPEICVFNRGLKNYVYLIQNNYIILKEIEIIGQENGFFKIEKNSLPLNCQLILRGINQVKHMEKLK